MDQPPKLLGIHIVKQGFFADFVSIVIHLPGTSQLTLAGAAATFAVPPPTATSGVGGWGHSRSASISIAAPWFFGLQAAGVSTAGQIPQGLASLTLPDLALIEQLLPGALGTALMSFTKTSGWARLCPPGRPSD